MYIYAVQRERERERERDPGGEYVWLQSGTGSDSCPGAYSTLPSCQGPLWIQRVGCCEKHVHMAACRDHTALTSLICMCGIVYCTQYCICLCASVVCVAVCVPVCGLPSGAAV